MRTLILAAVAVSCVLGWQAYLVRKETYAINKLEELNVETTMATKTPQWLWRHCGERLGRTVIGAKIDLEKVEATVPYLKGLSNLEGVTICCWPWDIDKYPKAESLLQRELPQVEIQTEITMCGFLKETVQVPDGGTILLNGIKKLMQERSDGAMKAP